MSEDNHEIIESENNGNREDYGYRPPPPPPTEEGEYKGQRVPPPPPAEKGDIEQTIEVDQSE